MTRDTVVRSQIAMLVFTMANAVVFGAGLITVLTIPLLNANAGMWIPVVVVLSIVLSAPLSWLIAPRLRARYWRNQAVTPR